MIAPRLAAEGIVVTFAGVGRAVDGASLALPAGRTLALLGESGSGKSTLARVLAGLLVPDAGTVRHDGRAARGVHPQFVQLVLQDAAAALNPRLTVRASLEEPLSIAGAPLAGRAEAALARVELPPELLDRTPDRLSGGQRARVVLARALELSPAALLLDEPLAALDASVAASVLQLVSTWQAETGAAVLLVTHDAATALSVASDLAIMGEGRVVEVGPAAKVAAAPEHPCTRALLRASPGVAGPG